MSTVLFSNINKKIVIEKVIDNSQRYQNTKYNKKKHTNSHKTVQAKDHDKNSQTRHEGKNSIISRLRIDTGVKTQWCGYSNIGGPATMPLILQPVAHKHAHLTLGGH